MIVIKANFVSTYSRFSIFVYHILALTGFSAREINLVNADWSQFEHNNVEFYGR